MRFYSFFCIILTSITVLTGCSPHAENGYIDVEDGHIFYQSFGSGEPIIILHGGPGLDHTYLLPQMLELAKDYRVIFYDQRGSGKSLDTPLDEEHINMQQFTDDVESIRKALGIEHFVLTGHSWGGLIAMNYAAEYPEHLSKLILLTPAPPTKSGQQAFMNEYAKRTHSMTAELSPLNDEAAFDKLTANELTELYRKLFGVYAYDPSDADKLTLTFDLPSAQSGFKVKSLILNHCWLQKPCNIFAKLHSIRTPTLMIYGTDDLVPLSSGEEIHQAIPQSEIVVLQECGHFPYIEKPWEMFEKMREFMKEPGH